MKTTINLLDPSQKNALNGVLSNKENVSVIFGPPGTGKSHLILSLLFELAVRGDKVLFVSQNTEALNVVIRMYRKLDKELGIKDYALSFLDFCWCLNDQGQKRVTYIKQQKGRIMTRPINTLPYAKEEIEDEIPYALTYRNLNLNENLSAEPEVIGFDELLMSSLKNIRHNDLIKDILHTVPDESYRNALHLLNDYSDKNNLFAELNNPKNALKYLNPERFDYTIHDAQIIVEDICNLIDETLNTNEMTSEKEVNINDYLNTIYQIAEYSDVINIKHFDESDISIKELAQMAKKRLSVDDELKETTEIKIPSSISETILEQKEDSEIIKLNDLSEIRDYSEALSKTRQYIKLLNSEYKIDKDTKINNLLSCAFSKIDFEKLSPVDMEKFNNLSYDDLKKIYDILKTYDSKGKLGKLFYSIPDDAIILTPSNIDIFTDNISLIETLLSILKNTEHKIKIISDSQKIRVNSINIPININSITKNPSQYIELCNTILQVLNIKLSDINNYTLEELDSIIERQINDISAMLSILASNKKIEFETIKEAIETINKNITNINIFNKHIQLDKDLEPFLKNTGDIERSYKDIIELSNNRPDLKKLLGEIKNTKVKNTINLETIDKIRNSIIEANQKGLFSPEFFIIHQGENLATWKKHVYTLVDYNRLDEFDTFISQNRFINNLKDILTPKNTKVIDAYLKNDNITYDEFREHLTRDIVGTIYNDAPASIRQRIDDKYFSEFKSNHKNLQIREYLSGLQTLKLKYEDPAKTLSYYNNWVPASTNIEKIRRNSEMIIDAFPVTIATPADVSKYITAKKAFYDYVIFDEASQLLPGQALPSIYRAKKAVIVGDPHQMPPSLTVSFGFNSITDDDSDGDGINSDEQSILDLAINLQLDATYHLMTHYRSESNRLFEPSLDAIYRKEGVEAIVEAKSNEMPFYIEDNLGDDNEKNFSSIVRRVEYYLHKKEDATFCILFSRNDNAGLQGFKKYLEKNSNTTISQLYEKDKILISTVTNCQGIEGDHTILYLPSYPSPRAMWFFKQTAGAYKRLNVSITRQKQTFDLIMGDPKNKWIQVCQDFRDDNNCDPSQKKSAIMLLNILTDAGQVIDEDYLEEQFGPNAQNIDSPLTQQLYDRLNEYYHDRLGKDLKIWCEVGWNMLIPDTEAKNKNNRNVGFRIDIGIYSIKHQRFIMGIEMDGATYHSGFKKEFSDLQRQATLEKKGWNIYRIWSTNWLQDTEAEFQNLVKNIDEYLVEEYDDKNEMCDEYDTYNHGDEGDLFNTPTEETQPEINNTSEQNNDAIYRPDDPTKAIQFENKLVSIMNDCMKYGKPIEMKYSNVQLSNTQKATVPYQTIYVRRIEEKQRVFLGSFSLSSSPYQIKLSDVFEYKTNIETNKEKEDSKDDDTATPETTIPKNKSVISEELMSFYLENNVDNIIQFRYQTSWSDSGKKWRTLKLIRFTEKYFWCRDIVTDKVTMYRRDRVLEIRI